jgi:hypothetical protein
METNIRWYLGNNEANIRKVFVNVATNIWRYLGPFNWVSENIRQCGDRIFEDILKQLIDHPRSKEFIGDLSMLSNDSKGKQVGFRRRTSTTRVACLRMIAADQWRHHWELSGMKLQPIKFKLHGESWQTCSMLSTRSWHHMFLSSRGNTLVSQKTNQGLMAVLPAHAANDSKAKQVGFRGRTSTTRDACLRLTSGDIIDSCLDWSWSLWPIKIHYEQIRPGKLKWHGEWWQTCCILSTWVCQWHS